MWGRVIKYIIISVIVWTFFRIAYVTYALKNTVYGTALVTDAKLVEGDYWYYTYTYFFEGKFYNNSLNDRHGATPLPHHTGECLGIEISVMHPSESYIKNTLEDDSETCALLREMVRNLKGEMPYKN